jgi:hypothetical protein
MTIDGNIFSYQSEGQKRFPISQWAESDFLARNQGNNQSELPQRDATDSYSMMTRTTTRARNRISRPFGSLAKAYDETIGLPAFCHIRWAFETLARRHGLRYCSAADIGCGSGLFARYLSDSLPADTLTHPTLTLFLAHCRMLISSSRV